MTTEGDCSSDQVLVDSALSDLARIELKSQDPLDLFKEWHTETKKFCAVLPDAVCLATVSKDLKVSARHVLLRYYDEHGFVIFTDGRSRKSQELNQVPNASMCILWRYINDRQEHIVRQVRIEGSVEQLSPKDYQHFYDREPLYCKIRSHLCWQGKPVDWDEQKTLHDELLQQVRTEKRDLPMPDHFVAYRLKPESMEYYFAYDHLIGDRVLFRKECESWTNQRIAA